MVFKTSSVSTAISISVKWSDKQPRLSSSYSDKEDNDIKRHESGEDQAAKNIGTTSISGWPILKTLVKLQFLVPDVINVGSNRFLNHSFAALRVLIVLLLHRLLVVRILRRWRSSIALHVVLVFRIIACS